MSIYRAELVIIYPDMVIDSWPVWVNVCMCKINGPNMVF